MIQNSSNRNLGLMLLIMLLGITSCRKEDPISNKDAVLQPYSLFFGSDQGEVINTNDGVNFRYYMTAGNYPASGIAVQNDYLFYASFQRVFRNKDGDRTMNSVYDGLQTGNGLYSFFSANNILNVPQEGAVYLGTLNSSICFYSNDHGNSWQDYNYDTCFDSPTNKVTKSDFLINVDTTGLFALWDNQQKTSPRIYYKQHGKPVWHKLSVSNSIMDNGKGPYGIASVNNAVVIYEYSNDNGLNYQFCKLDKNNYSLNSISTAPAILAEPVTTLCIKGYEDKYMFIGTSNGLYRLNLQNKNLRKMSSDLSQGTIVNDIAIKKNVYRSGNEEVNIFLATTTGIYKSQDLGENFTKVYEGSFYSID